MEWFPAVQKSKENQLKQAKYKFNQFLPNLAKKKKKKQTNKPKNCQKQLCTIHYTESACEMWYWISLEFSLMFSN